MKNFLILLSLFVLHIVALLIASAPVPLALYFYSNGDYFACYITIAIFIIEILYIITQIEKISDLFRLVVIVASMIVFAFLTSVMFFIAAYISITAYSFIITKLFS